LDIGDNLLTDCELDARAAESLEATRLDMDLIFTRLQNRVMPRPPASVMRLWAAPVSTLRISTALGIAAPDASVTVPCKYAPTVCGKTAAGAASKAISSAEDFTRYPPLRNNLIDYGARASETTISSGTLLENFS
jgi:hypothetical protein